MPRPLRLTVLTLPSLQGGSKSAPTVFISFLLGFRFYFLLVLVLLLLIETMHCFRNYSAARVDDCSGGSLSLSLFDFVLSAAEVAEDFIFFLFLFLSSILDVKS